MPIDICWHFSFSLFHKLHAAKYSTSRQVRVYCKKYHWYHHYRHRYQYLHHHHHHHHCCYRHHHYLQSNYCLLYYCFVCLTGAVIGYLQPISCIGSMTCGAWWYMKSRRVPVSRQSARRFLNGLVALFTKNTLNLVSRRPLKAESPPGCKNGFENVGWSLFLDNV